MAKVGLGLIGLGTVGTGVVKVIQQNSEVLSERTGAQLKFVRYCDKFIRSKSEVGITAKEVSRNYKDLINDPSIDIIVELIGGYEPARTIILEALKSGKHVVTANKAVLAKYWDEVIGTAQKYRRLIYFEASVGGGIPVIQGLSEGLISNRIKKIMGILNGTTNYILTQMAESNISFEKALKLAQKSGFAEADPAFDVEGIDSAHKLAILSSLAFGGWVKISDVYCEGISNLNLLDLQLAEKEFGYGLKLLGIAKERDGKVEVKVHPTFLPKHHPFLSVKNEYNAISIEGDAAGDVMFYGKGAGQMAAASAVVSDIVILARHVVEGTAGRLPEVTYDERVKIDLLKEEDFQSKYYLRFTTYDRPGVLSKISGILGNCGVSIASVYQPAQEESTAKRKTAKVPILITTHIDYEGKVQKALAEIDRLPFVKSKTVLIRIES